jgi:hypothetical protein
MMGALAKPKPSNPALQAIEAAKPLKIVPSANLLRFDTDASIADGSQHIVKGIFGKGDLVALYGASGAGKSFLAIWLGYQIAHGSEIMGRRVARGPVLYVGLEGRGGLGKRIVAARETYGTAGKRFAALAVAVDLSKATGGDAATKPIVDACAALMRHAGEPVSLVIIDTLARAMSGDDENSAQDMTSFIEKRAATISRETGAAVMLVHHSGKDQSRGLRGSYALQGACDAVVHIDVTRTVTLEKVKDGQDGALCSFTLRTVELGRDADGDPITSCVVEIAAEAVVRTKSRTRLTDQARRALDVLNRLHTDDKEAQVSHADLNLVGAVLPAAFLEKDWREACEAARLASGEPEAERKAFTRQRDKLITSNHIGRNGEFVWLIGSRAHVGQSPARREVPQAHALPNDGTSWDKRDNCPTGMPRRVGTDRDNTLRGVPVVPCPGAPKPIASTSRSKSVARVP